MVLLELMELKEQLEVMVLLELMEVKEQLGALEVMELLELMELKVKRDKLVVKVVKVDKEHRVLL